VIAARPEQAPAALKHADTIARLGRAPAVTLVAATQRPTQKGMGQGAVRSQMNIRIAFRIQEQRDVDLILEQGMLKAGWHAHKLNAPGRFLLWSPEHDTPRLPHHRRRRDTGGRAVRTQSPAPARHLPPCAYRSVARARRHPGARRAGRQPLCGPGPARR
jgi:hypothetical protein